MLLEVVEKPSRRYPNDLQMSALVLPYGRGDLSLLNGINTNIYTHASIT